MPSGVGSGSQKSQRPLGASPPGPGGQKPTLVRPSRLQKAEISSRVTRGWRPHSGSGLPGRCLRAWGLPRYPLASGLCSGSAQLTRPGAWGLSSQTWGLQKVLRAGAWGGVWGTKELRGELGAGGAVARASKVPPKVGGSGARSISRGTEEPYQSSERSRGVPVGSIHSSPPGRQTRVGARVPGSGRRERRNRRSANTAVVRRKTAARAARTSMMGTQGPQGSGGHEEAANARGSSMGPEGCSGVGGIWRGRERRDRAGSV
uniref:Transmembrane protein C16orf54 homolog isoform X1 n=1 Tax=Sus scrofa TaxID=9823 RepID=A0A480IAM3_PIG